MNTFDTSLVFTLAEDRRRKLQRVAGHGRLRREAVRPRQRRRR